MIGVLARTPTVPVGIPDIRAVMLQGQSLQCSIYAAKLRFGVKLPAQPYLRLTCQSSHLLFLAQTLLEFVKKEDDTSYLESDRLIIRYDLYSNLVFGWYSFEFI